MPLVTVWPTPNGLPIGEHEIADLERIAVAHLERRQRLAMGVDLEHREVGALVGQQDARLELAPVGEHDA